MMPDADKLAESPVLQVLSRISMLLMPVLLAAVVFFGKAWVEDRFSGLRSDVDSLQAEMPLAKERIKVVETTIERGRQDREQFQDQTTDMLNRMLSVQTEMMRELSALRATVEERERQQQMDRRGR
jgi:hypothetical protein